MLSIVPVRISAVKTFGPDTIPNLLNHGLGIARRAKFGVFTIVLTKVAGKQWPTTLTSPEVPLPRPHQAPQDSQGRSSAYHTHQCHT